MKKLPLVPALIAILFMSLVVISACEDVDVGIPCQIGAGAGTGTGSGTGTTVGAQVNKQALDCRSRLCIKYSQTAQPMCTRICETDDDCPSKGEIDTCKSAFKCVVGQKVGGLKCCKMCVCETDLTASKDADATYCSKEAAPDCPELE